MSKSDEMRPWSRALWRGANAHLQRSATREYQRALKDGILERPTRCEDCGRDGRRIVGHHEDYAEPLDVAWVCGLCHAGRHRNRDLHFETLEDARP